MRRYLLPAIFGLAGAALLSGLGLWQLERLAWKEHVLGDIETRIAAAPVALPEAPAPRAHRYLPVRLRGTIGPEALRVLVSRKGVGAGYRLISPFETDGRRVLLDRGFIEVSEEIPAPPEGRVTVTGNLHWPDDRNASTPGNDVAGNTWFARDLGPMAAELDTEPVLVVARKLSRSDGALTPLPVDTAGIPNDHLEYALTWFALAATWLGMTGLFLWRTRKTAKGVRP